jgi:hypothetical protein
VFDSLERKIKHGDEHTELPMVNVWPATMNPGSQSSATRIWVFFSSWCLTDRINHSNRETVYMRLVTYRYSIWWVRDGISFQCHAQQRGRRRSCTCRRAHWNNQGRAITDKTDFTAAVLKASTVKWFAVPSENKRGNDLQCYQKAPYVLILDINFHLSGRSQQIKASEYCW